VQLWSLNGTPRLVQSLAPLQSLAGPSKGIQALAFSPDGGLLAASDDIQTRSLPGIPPVPQTLLATWRTTTGRLTGSPTVLEVTAGQDGSEALAYSPNGKLLAASLSDGRTLLLDSASDRVNSTVRPDSGGTALAFAPGGTLAIGTLAGTVELWNPATGRRSAPSLIAASAPVTSVAFDPGGGRFATTAYHGGTVRLWSTSTLQQEGPALDLDRGVTSAAIFEPHRRGLLVVDEGGGAFTWPDSLRDWTRRACAVAGRNMTRTEWSRLVAASGYTATCR
jgi:WD40 repeat protein